jgi:1-phosphofructokinase
VLALCGPYPSEALPLEIYGNLVTDVKANGTPVIVDLSPPRLDSALEGGPDLVKINDWELASYIEGPVDSEQRMRAAAQRLLEAGAGSVIITRAEEPAMVLRGDDAWELIPPRFERGSREGCGDSMGALGGRGPGETGRAASPRLNGGPKGQLQLAALDDRPRRRLPHPLDVGRDRLDRGEDREGVAHVDGAAAE